MADTVILTETGDEVPTPPTDLVHDDGEPLESLWHRDQMVLLIDLLDQAMTGRGREDVLVGGNNFIYYSAEQAEAVRTRPIETTRHFRGPDVFLVAGVDPTRERQSWIVWEEGGRYPDLIIELLSRKTATIDRTVKKAIYERTFRTPDYVMYDRDHDRLEGFHLVDHHYLEIEPDARGWLWLPTVQLWLGRWRGMHRRSETTWIRLFDRDGRMIPTGAEKGELSARAAQVEAQAAQAEAQAAQAEAQAAQAEARAAQAEAQTARERAEAERRRADAGEAELARLRAALPGRSGA